MKNIRVVIGTTALGIALAVGCGDDPTSSKPTPSDGGEGNSGGDGNGGGKGGTPNTGGTENTSGMPGSEAGMSSTLGGVPGENGAGSGPIGPGCGDGPACNEDTQECVGGECLLVDGEACTANADCVHTCINEQCGPRAEVLGDCDYEGAGGAGGAGAGGAGAGGAGNAGSPGAGGEGGGDGIYVPPEEIGNGDDLDCLDGLACDSGTCKRKQMTDCTGPEQCLSGLCHKSKCTLQEPGVCTANACAAPENSVCAPTTTSTNQCSFNYLPNSSCTVDIKGTYCYAACTCTLAP